MHSVERVAEEAHGGTQVPGVQGLRGQQRAVRRAWGREAGCRGCAWRAGRRAGSDSQDQGQRLLRRGRPAAACHVYAGGAHLKLGAHRYNLVQGGKRYSAVADAYRALGSHALGGTLWPWVDAALDYFGV